MRLSEYLALDGNSATGLAKATGTAVSTITRLAREERRPSLALAERIASATNQAVQPGDFVRGSPALPEARAA